MANPDSVGQNTQDSFGYFRIAQATTVSLGAVANAVVALPAYNGGTGGTTNYIIRRITVANLSNTVTGGAAGNAATVNVSVGTTNDGGNLVANAQALTNLTGANTFADLVLSATANTTTSNANALFFNVTSNALANNQVIVSVFGQTVNF